MTAIEVFRRAMYLSDNANEAGEVEIADNNEYRYRVLSIVNMLMNELYPYSDTYESTSGSRPVLEPLYSLDEDIRLDDFCAGTVLVYGLAARLFTDENANIASFYEQEYERLLNWLKSGGGIATEASAIEDVYSGGYYDANGTYHNYTGYYPHNEMGRWG